MAKFPVEEKLPKQTKSPERDAMLTILRIFKERGIDKKPLVECYADPELSAICNRYAKLMKEILRIGGNPNNKNIEVAALEKWLKQVEESDKRFGITYRDFHSPKDSYKDVVQTVIQINAENHLLEQIKQDPDLKTIFEYLNWGGSQSGHPIGKNGIGWVRADYNADEDLLYVDEIQCDLISQCGDLRSFVTTNTSAEWFESRNPELQKKIVKEHGRQSADMFWNSQRHWIEEHDITLEKINNATKKFIKLTEDWEIHVVATVLDIAREHGIKNVAISTPEAVLKRDPSVGAEKLKIMYDKIGKRFGFTKKQISTLQGTKAEGTEVWVRTAKKQK